MAAALIRTNRAATLQARFTSGGWLRELRSGNGNDGVMVNLFPGTELEGSPLALVLRLHDDAGALHTTPLIGPRAPAAWRRRGQRQWVEGEWRSLQFKVELRLAADAAAWFWHIALVNRGAHALRLDLLHTQDVALAPFGALRLNEAYVSQYIDHQPLTHATQGTVIASRQNAAVKGRTPWLLLGSLGRAIAYATDGLQLAGRGLRDPSAWPAHDLPGQRLQHEHSLAALQDEAFVLPPGATAQRGFFGWLEADHPAATSAADLVLVDRALALPERSWRAPGTGPRVTPPRRSLFADARPLAVLAPDANELAAWTGIDAAHPMRHVERDSAGALLSYFQGDGRHVVLAAKEAAVLRPHGHLLRSGAHWTPDEGSVTSTAWMRGVFASALTQGHASANAVLSNQRSYLNLFRAHGQRVFVATGDDKGGDWQLLEMPSAWEITSRACRWFYRHAQGLLVVTSEVGLHSPEITLAIEVRDGPPLRVRITQHFALNGDDGLSALPMDWLAGEHEISVRPAAGSAMHRRFPDGRIRLRALADTAWQQTSDDRVLFSDGVSRHEPYLCLDFAASRRAGVTIRCELLPAGADVGADAMAVADADFDAQTTGHLALTAARDDDAGRAVAQLDTMAPWLAHNALVHYLSPRGLEQFSGGGWGTRDVSQGPFELLLSLGRHAELRDLLRRLFSAQNADGDWPQWFMFYPRDAHVRAGDSHGDIVFWPLVALAQYVVASGDATVLQEMLPYHGNAAPESLQEHVDRALAVVDRRIIAGTQLVAYGHGDWNDALQPADPAMRERLCSAWTVTLHYRMLTLLAQAWQRIGRDADATELRDRATQVLADFQHLLIVDDQLAGYASFEEADRADHVIVHLLHPRDERTGIHHSALAMVHAIIDELFTPEQAAHHVALIGQHLQGPDGLRLFDRPLRYTGGTQRLFQRGESASYFGREIGLMYMHAHLRWAEALAHLGHAEAFFHALRLTHPIGIEALVASAARRQSNCYYSSSDAAFTDRVEALDHYERIERGEVALEGGWRVYSSGAGIAFRLIVQCLLGLRQQQDALIVDPVMPPALDGLRARLQLYRQRVEVTYRVGPRGHGVTRIELDGEEMAMTTPTTHRYRRPAVAIDAARLRSVPKDGVHRLEIRVGFED